MIIAILKPDNEYFVLAHINEPLNQGWRVSDCGKVAISLAKRYSCDGFIVTETPVDISRTTEYQIFGCFKDTYVHFENIGICKGDLQHTFRLGLEDFQSMPVAMMTRIINNLNVAEVVL